MHKDIRLLSLGFLFIFAGYSGVQQFLTTYFRDNNLTNIGFQSLVFIYVAFIMAAGVSIYFVNRFGAKKCLIISSIFYTIYILAVVSLQVQLIYIASVFLGVAASLLWTAQGSYLLRVSHRDSFGSHAGLFNTFYSLGAAVGIFILGFLIAKFAYTTPFLVYALFPLLGTVCLLLISDHRYAPAVSPLYFLKRSITSSTALRISLLWFSLFIVSALTFSVLPLHIKDLFGVASIGMLSAIFSIAPIALSYVIGKLSDTRGRGNIILGFLLVGVVSLFVLYISQVKSIFLFGIVLLAIHSSVRAILPAFLGDISTKENLEYLQALFIIMQNIGLTISLLISTVITSNIIYIVSLALLLLSIIILFPIFRTETNKVKEKLVHEIGA